MTRFETDFHTGDVAIEDSWARSVTEDI